MILNKNHPNVGGKYGNMREDQKIYRVFLYSYAKTMRQSNKYRLFIKPAIQERGMESRECRERGDCSLWFRGISWRIPGNALILAFRGMLEKIPRNVSKDSWECSRKFRGQKDMKFHPDMKKRKRCANTSSWDEILKWACFFNFWRMYSNMLSKVKVSCVVKIKLFFYGLIFWIDKTNSVMHIPYKNFDKVLLFSRNQVFCLKIWKFWRAPTTLQFNIFGRNFAHVFYLLMSRKGCVGFFFVNVLNELFFFV